MLITGATGYIGGRLAPPRLVEEGHRVRVVVRSPEKLRDVPWHDSVEIKRGDLTDSATLSGVFDDIDVVYYLVHAMGGGGSFSDIDKRSAENVAAAAAMRGGATDRLPGGLHPSDRELSTHLQSRLEVGRILLDSEVPAVVFQAGVVIGSGSASFEMVRHLTNRLPVMTTPKWVHNNIQPIAVRDVLHYLIAAAATTPEVNRAFDIGGPDVMQYGEMMNTYADVAGLVRRRILVLPVLTPASGRSLGGIGHADPTRFGDAPDRIPAERRGDAQSRHRRLHPASRRGPHAVSRSGATGTSKDRHR